MTVCSPEMQAPERLLQPLKQVATRPTAKPQLSAISSSGHAGRTWTVVGSLILASAAALRFYDIGLRPLHNDEGVNGFFLLRLFRDGVYRYDPANYHGPTLYYFAHALACVGEWLAGDSLSTAMLRLGPALFGIAVIALALKLRPELGRVGSLSAAALLALSPGAVYFSRDFIHETLFVFFTLALVMAFQRYRAMQKPSWLMAAAIAAGLLFATKETAAISVIVLLLAAIISAKWTAYRGGRKPLPAPPASPKRPLACSVALWMAAAVAFIAVAAIFYSSFGSNPAGLRDALRAFAFWSKTAAKDQRYPWYTYVTWMFREETCIFVLALVGAALALMKATSRFALFAALWGFGLLAAYSLVPYKTPWLMLNFVVPMALVGGWAVNFIYQQAPKRTSRGFALAMVSALLCLSAYEALRLNFYEYDDPAHPYVYVQTRRGFLDLVAEVNRRAASGAGPETSIVVLSRDYWPLPWYLRDYAHAAYPGRGLPGHETLVIASAVQRRLLAPALRGYDQVGVYPSRPGVDLVLLVRHESSAIPDAAAAPNSRWPESKANPGSGFGE
jgi:uncharacterized protein (TIGR03663 family)